MLLNFLYSSCQGWVLLKKKSTLGFVLFLAMTHSLFDRIFQIIFLVRRHFIQIHHPIDPTGIL
jgi:hypothetical protein